MITTVDWVIIGGYLVLSLAVGVVFTRRAGRSTKDFFLSGRSLPWWLAGTSMVATSFASDTPLVITGWVRREGVSGNWLWWSWAAGGMLSVFLLSRLWRRAEVMTDVELTELRYGGRSAAALRGFKAGYFALPINSIAMAWVMVAMVKLLGVLFGFSPVAAVGVCIAVAMVYSAMSGLWGIVVTDLIQFAVAVGGTAVLAVLTVSHFGGLAGLRAAAVAAAPMKEQVLHFLPRPPADPAPFWANPVVGFCILLSIQWWANKNADGGGAIIQRMASTRNERHALLATLWFNIAHYALRPWPWILVALGSLALFPQAKDGETAYPLMIKALATPGWMGLILVAFLGAFMSTIDTQLNLSSSYFVNDFYRRFVRRNASERTYVLVGRLMSVYFMLLSSCLAILSDSISELFFFLVAFSSGIGLVLILRWFWWRVNAWSEISAMAASSVIASVFHLFKRPLGNPPYPVILLVTVAGSTMVWLAVTRMTAPVPAAVLAGFYRKVRPPGAWGPVRRRCGLAPYGGLGRQVLAWLSGTVMVLAATMAPGKFLLGAPGQGGLYLAAAAAGAAVTWLAARTRPPLARG